MVSSTAIRAGRAFVELFADDAQLRKGLKGAADRLRAFGGVVRNIGLAFTALGVGITAPLIAAAKAWASAGDELYDMAQRTGMSVEQLSGLSYAAAREAPSSGLAGTTRAGFGRIHADPVRQTGPHRLWRLNGMTADAAQTCTYQRDTPGWAAQARR